MLQTTIQIIQGKDIAEVESDEKMEDDTSQPELSYFDRIVTLKKLEPISAHWLQVFHKQDEINIAQLTAALPEVSQEKKIDKCRINSETGADINTLYALCKLDHDNIQQMFGIVLYPLALVMEYQDCIRLVAPSEKLDFDYPTIRYLLIDVAMALLYLQSVGISVHEFRNEDILIFRQPQITAKISILNWKVRFGEDCSPGSAYSNVQNITGGDEIREVEYSVLRDLAYSFNDLIPSTSGFHRRRSFCSSLNPFQVPYYGPTKRMDQRGFNYDLSQSQIRLRSISILNQNPLSRICYPGPATSGVPQSHAPFHVPILKEKEPTSEMAQIISDNNVTKCNENYYQVMVSFRNLVRYLLEGEAPKDVPLFFHYLIQYMPDSLFHCVLILNHIDPYHECTEMEQDFIIALSQQTKEYQTINLK